MNVCTWLAFSKQDGLCRGVERFARSNRVFAVTSQAWDRDAFLLGAPLIALDPRNDALKGADPSDEVGTDLKAVI